MNARIFKIATLAVMALTMFSVGFSGNVYARGGGESEAGHNNSVGNSVVAAPAVSAPEASISEQQRVIISKFIANEYRQDCASEKKASDCSPEAQGTSYALGEQLGADVNAKMVPAELRSQLAAVTGHEYKQIGRDIVLIENSGRKVVDSVTLSSVLGR